MKKLLLPLLFTFIFVHSALALNVGVAPLTLDLGNVQPGTRISGSFYVVSDGSTEFIADLTKIRAPTDFYTRTIRGHDFTTSQASEEDVSQWITFLENSVTVPKEQYFVSEINSYVNRKIDFVLTVPSDAEPGYHAGQILPQPRISPASTGGVGVGIITLVKTSFIFNVEGDARRSAEIVSFDYQRVDEKYEEVTVFVKNTGTVTESISLDWVEIDEGAKKTRLSGVGYKRTQPNQIAEFKTKYDVSEKELGTYKTTAKISWMSGETEKAGTIEVLEYREEAPITGDVVAPPLPGAEIPLWIVPTLIIFFVIVFYWWHNGKY